MAMGTELKLGFAGAAALLLVVFPGMSYNSSNSKHFEMRGAGQKMVTAVQQRGEMIPQLVEVTKGFAAQERGVLEAVTKARADATKTTVDVSKLTSDPAALKAFMDSQAALGGALSRLIATVERYPDIKSGANFLALQQQIEGSQNRVRVERNNFITATADYNRQITAFPYGKVVASFAGFKEAPEFTAPADTQANPTVKF